MKLLMFSVYDAAAGAYLRPFFAETNGLAVRSFSDAVNDSSTPFAAHPEDYTLFRVGGFDQESGAVISQLVESLGNALTFKVESPRA